MASHAGRLQCHRAPTPGWHFEYQLWAAPLGTLHPAGRASAADAGNTSGGKDAGWKSPKNDFPIRLGNPAQSAGFPLSHRHHGDGYMNKTKKLKNRTFHLLQKADIFTCYEQP